MTNPILPLTALLRPKMPGLYQRASIYDITWTDPSYLAYLGQKIVPAIGSLVQDSDSTPLWVIGIDPVTCVPEYEVVPLDSDNDAIVNLVNYGNAILRLYVDDRALPYPVTPDTKCVVLGKSPRFYSLSRYPGTAQESIISQYFDATGTLVSAMVPLQSLTPQNNSWTLPRCNTSVILDDNEEILVKVFSEDGAEVYSAKLFAKHSSIINDDVLLSPKIVGLTVSGNQTLVDGRFFVYEKQDFSSLGLSVSLVYDDGQTSTVPVDGVQCVLYGDKDFIASFSGLTQTMMIKYYRSANESINSSLADTTGTMISTEIKVVVIPNTLGVTGKISVIPQYNTALGRYILKYWMYFADGRSHVDVSAYTTFQAGSTLRTDSSYFGVSQTAVLSVDMKNVDPLHYPTSAIYTQTIVATFFPPVSLVKWTIKDSASSPYIYGQDNNSARRPGLKFDKTRKQYFIASYIFANQQAFINSFYTQTSPPYDPTVAQIPQTPTHFIVRDVVSGIQKCASPIPLASYAQAFSLVNDLTGAYVNSSIMIEFLNVINVSQTNVLFGGCVDVSLGTYQGS